MSTGTKIYRHKHIEGATCRIVAETAKGYKVMQTIPQPGKRENKEKQAFYSLIDFHPEKGIWHQPITVF